MAKKVKTDNDGGYYAIKGFLYQFDKNLLEIIDNKTSQIEIENIQDINFEKYVIQVKLKETAIYYDSSVSKPVKQLIDIFKDDSDKKLILYCHFSNKSPEKKQLTLSELNSILDDNSNNKFTEELKKRFIQNFILQFSDNYAEQFNTLITNIKAVFSCSDDNIAIIYHSILHSKLMQLAVLPNKSERIINFSTLQKYLHGVDKTIYFKAYEFYNNKEKYEKLIKREFFTSNNPNISNYQRLFIIEISDSFSNSELIDIINKLENKYFRKGKSSAPFILFQNIDETSLINLQIDLVDKNIEFSDGTKFHGDKFRLDILKNQNKTKIIRAKNSEEVYQNIQFDEVYYLASNFTISHNLLTSKSKFLKIQISEHQQLLKIL